MRNPDIDFQPRRPGLLGMALLLAGGVLCADTWYDWQGKREQLADLQAQMNQLEKRSKQLRRNGQPGNEPETALTAEQGKALRQAENTIRIDWEALYRHIDRATGEDLVLLGITPNTAAHTLQLSGEARNLPAILAFIEALRQAPLEQVALLSHKIKSDDPQRPISFEIAANWKTTR